MTATAKIVVLVALIVGLAAAVGAAWAWATWDENEGNDR